MTTTEPTMSCSFCLRTSAEVDRLLAGASGHICDACVRACDQILADPATPFPTMDSDSDASLLARLEPAALGVGAAEAGLRGLVSLLRDRGVSWARIGDGLGVSRQSVWERFGPTPE